MNVPASSSAQEYFLSCIGPSGFQLTKEAEVAVGVTDMCPNLSGGPYSTVPDGYLYDSISGCVFDSSYNTPTKPSRQSLVRISMSLTVQCHIFLRVTNDTYGNCVVSLPNVCPNLSGYYTSVPAGMTVAIMTRRMGRFACLCRQEMFVRIFLAYKCRFLQVWFKMFSGNCVPAPTQQVCTDTSSSDYNTGYPCHFLTQVHLQTLVQISAVGKVLFLVVL